MGDASQTSPSVEGFRRKQKNNCTGTWGLTKTFHATYDPDFLQQVIRAVLFLLLSMQCCRVNTGEKNMPDTSAFSIEIARHGELFPHR